MKPDRWQLINDLFQSVIECAPEKRRTFLEESCRGDSSLCREVESLIAASEQTQNFIELPAFEAVPDLLNQETNLLADGKAIGHYRIESLLGSGGMGEVYLARDERLGRKVALKLLPEHLIADETHLNRFKAEARAASALNHPNILTVYDIGSEGDRQFIATEFIEGMTLRACLAEERVSLHNTLTIVLQVASALVAAHQAGIVHRDIKPENIMLRPDGYAKVLDFGIAKLTEPEARADGKGIETTEALRTRPGLLLGTTRYMSPEQLRGQKIDARSDIWSLGVVFYEMLEGTSPFPGETPSDCVASILKTEPLPLTKLQTTPAILQTIVEKALRKKRDERYQTIEEMLADLREFKENSDKSAPRAEMDAKSLLRSFWRSKLVAALALTFVLLAAAAIFYFYYFNNSSPPPNDKSIAVLPFADLSQARDQGYFCDGVHEEILSRLAKISDLKVISRTSTQRYRSAPDSLREIARHLGVANILEGTVQKAEGQIRVNVQLIRAEDDSQLWGEKYDRKSTDIFAVESEIAKAIADTLRAKLTGSEQRALVSQPTQNPEAHQLYLKAAHFLNERTAPNLRAAIAYFKEAIGKDPNYSLAYAGLADAYALLTLWGGEGPRETVPKAKAAARQAAELDESLAEAHNSLGVILALYDFDFALSKKEFERAIELNSNYATAHHQFANLNLVKTGDFDRAIAEGGRAVELDPLSSIINADQGKNLLWARRYDEAIAQFNKTLSLEPGFYYAHYALAEAFQLKGQMREAIVEYEKAAQLTDDPTATALLAQAYARNGERDKAEKLLAQLEESAGQRNIGPCTFALVHLGLGENEKALDELEQAWRERIDPDINEIKVEPLLDPLRGNPRFERLVANVMGVSENNTRLVENKSIAVLPFTDLSQARDQEYFCDGIQEEILTRLAKIADLKVIARTSVTKYKSTPDNLGKIARELGVANILEGSVQKAGDAVRVNVQLINAQNNAHLWAEIYDRKLTDLFAVESDISKAIADTLQAKLTGSEKHAIATSPTQNTQAHQLYLKGRFFWNKRTGPDLKKALDYFNQAVAADPSYGVAYAGISDVYGLLPVFSAATPRESYARSEAAARKALELDDTVAEAHTSLGAALARRFAWSQAEKEFKRAIELNPNYATAHHWYSDSILAPEVRLKEALEEMQRALEVDPLSPIINGELAMTYYALGQYDKALEQSRRTIDLEPGFYVAHMWLADALESKGDYVAAIAEYEKAWQLSNDPVVLGWLARTYALSGKKSEALKLLDQLNELSKTRYVPDYTFAIANLGLSNKGETLRWLEQCYQNGASDLLSLKSDPRLRPLHGEPRYQRLVAQVFSEKP